jgi:amino acid permease
LDPGGALALGGPKSLVINLITIGFMILLTFMALSLGTVMAVYVIMRKLNKEKDEIFGRV